MDKPEKKETSIVHVSDNLIKIGKNDYRYLLKSFSLSGGAELLRTGDIVSVETWSSCFGNGGSGRYGRRKSRSQIRAVRNYLRSQGLFVVGYYDNRMGRDGKLLPTGELKAVSLFTPEGDEKQRQAIIEQIEKLEAQRGRMLNEAEIAREHLKEAA